MAPESKAKTSTDVTPATVETATVTAAPADPKVAESQLGPGVSDFEPVTLYRGDTEKQAISQAQVYQLKFEGYTETKPKPAKS